jgi:hypothetical protein
VAGSIGVAAGAAAGCSAAGPEGCSSFLLHADAISKKHNASALTVIIVQLVFLFIMSLSP